MFDGYADKGLDNVNNWLMRKGISIVDSPVCKRENTIYFYFLFGFYFYHLEMEIMIVDPPVFEGEMTSYFNCLFDFDFLAFSCYFMVLKSSEKGDKDC